jgi:hypothetical protein
LNHSNGAKPDTTTGLSKYCFYKTFLFYPTVIHSGPGGNHPDHPFPVFQNAEHEFYNGRKRTLSTNINIQGKDPQDVWEVHQTAEDERIVLPVFRTHQLMSRPDASSKAFSFSA